MWDRLELPAQQAIREAQGIAAAGGCAFVTPEHLLRGLLRVPESGALRVLEGLGVAPAGLEAVVLRHLPASVTAGDGEPMLTPRALRVLQLALAEASRFGGEPVGAEHLLMGLAREGGSVAARALANVGAGPQRVRAELYALRGETAPAEADVAFAPWPPKRAPDQAPTGTTIPPVAALLASTSLVAQVGIPILLGFTFVLWRPTVWRADLVLLCGAALWEGLLGVVLFLPVLRPERWAWAPATGMLFAKSAVMLAAAMLVLVVPQFRREVHVIIPLIPAAFFLMSTAAMFHSRGWWGVERRAWHTLLRGGGWALGGTLLLESGFLLAAASRVG